MFEKTSFVVANTRSTIHQVLCIVMGEITNFLDLIRKQHRDYLLNLPIELPKPSTSLACFPNLHKPSVLV